MHYVFYSVIILGVLAVCLSLARLPGRSRLSDRQMDLAARARRRRKQQSATEVDYSPRQGVVLRRELKKVPIPWGWPGSATYAGHGPGGGPGSLKEWMDHLIDEKRTIDDAEYRQHKDKALRSMLEDRFGNAAKPTEMHYRKVNPPRLQDPDRPPDQMDNFPSGRTDAIVQKLSRQPGKPKSVESGGKFRKTGSLGDIKKPWGW